MHCWCPRSVFTFGLNTEFYLFFRLTCPFCNTMPSFKIYNLPNSIDCEFNEVTLVCIFLNLIFYLIFQYIHFHDHTIIKRLFVSKPTCPLGQIYKDFFQVKPLYLYAYTTLKLLHKHTHRNNSVI